MTITETLTFYGVQFWIWSASLNATHFIAFAICYAVGRRHGATPNKEATHDK